MAEAQEIWRWNSDLAWHYHCSMFYEAAMAQEANNTFMRYHHVRSCIYFAVSAFEAFLNGQMRRALQSKGFSESEILEKLRRPTIDEKRKKWPSQICGQDITFPDLVNQIFKVYKDIRDETTHPKQRDHSIYPKLETADLRELVQSMSTAVVIIYEGLGDPFPYWVLGWNYVGMNNNPAYPCQLNNMNGFIWSLKGMGLKISAAELDWDKRNMATLPHYLMLKNTMDKYPYDIEPYCATFPTRPRLTRRWWDHKFIIKSIEEADD